MADKLSEFILKEHERMKGSRENWDPHWQEVADFVVPRKNQVYTSRSQPGGEKRSQNVYDSTAIHANEILGSALQGMLTNPSTQWFEISTGIPELDSQDRIRSWLQKAARRTNQIMNTSNFQTEIHEVYTDLGSLGTSVMRVEEDKELVVRYQSRPIYEHWIKENHKGLVDTVSRELKKTSRQIKQEFNFNKAKKRLDQYSSLQFEKFDQDPNKEWNIVHFVSPREDFDKEEIKGIGSRFPFVSIYVVQDLDLVIELKGFLEFPYIVSRWTKTSGEIYGRSPSIKALADIKMINKMMQTQIRAAQKVADPPLQVPDDGMMLPIKAVPGGINYYRAGTPDRIFPLESGANLGINQQMMEDVRRRVREAFFIDQLQLQEGPQMTATEVLQRTEEKLRLLGPVLGRQHFELLKPLINRTIGIIGRAGQLPPDAPPELQGLNIQVQFSSMISRAQKASEADNITRIIQVAAPILQAQPEVLDNIDGDGFLKFLGNIFNAPQEMFRSEKERDGMRQQREKLAKEQVEREAQNVDSQSAKNLGIKIGE